MSVRGAIGIKDNVTAVLQAVKKEQQSFREDVEATRKSMQRTYDKKHSVKVETAHAVNAVKTLRKKLEPLRSRLVKVVAIKDMAKSKLNSIKSKLRVLGSMSVSPVVKLKNKVGEGLGKITSGLGKLLKGVAIPVSIAVAGGVAGLTKAMGAGMELEQQKISMEHFIGATNRDLGIAEVKKVAEDFTNELRENANATPFETGEVIAAGSRAIAIANGNTAEAMSLVTLAEDMAAASGGTKSISDAIEALADAKLGEMERLKEFGFKVSKEEFDKKGFLGVSKDLNEFYGGASEKLAQSGAGIISTIKGKLKSSFADFGLKMVDRLKPLFTGVVSLIDKYSPYFDEFGTKIADGIMGSLDRVKSFIPHLKSLFNTFKPIAMNLYSAIVPVVVSIMKTLQVVIPAVIPVIQSVIGTVSDIMIKASPIIAEVVGMIGQAISTLAPVFQTIFDSIGAKVGSVIDFVASKMGFVHQVFDFVLPAVADILTTAWGVIDPVLDIAVVAFKTLWKVVEFVFPAIQGTIQTVWNIIKPVVESIQAGLDTVANAWDWLVGKVTGETKKESNASSSSESVGKNAMGTDNWRGGLTWVGENGAELIDLPKGTRILPNKTSARLMNSSSTLPPVNVSSNQINSKNSIVLNIAKIAESVIVREEADIYKLIDAVGNEIVKRLSLEKMVST